MHRSRATEQSVQNRVQSSSSPTSFMPNRLVTLRTREIEDDYKKLNNKFTLLKAGTWILFMALTARQSYRFHTCSLSSTRSTIYWWKKERRYVSQWIGSQSFPLENVSEILGILISLSFDLLLFLLFNFAFPWCNRSLVSCGCSNLLADIFSSAIFTFAFALPMQAYITLIFTDFTLNFIISHNKVFFVRSEIK